MLCLAGGIGEKVLMPQAPLLRVPAADVLHAVKGDVVATFSHAEYEGRVTCSPWGDYEKRGACPDTGQGTNTIGVQMRSSPASKVRATGAGDR